MKPAVRVFRPLAVLLLAGLVLLPTGLTAAVVLAAPASAQDAQAKPAPPAQPAKPAKPAGKAAPATSDKLTTDDLDERLMANDAARWSLLITKVLPILLGVALLIAWFLKRDKIKGGVLPPPPQVEPTFTFPLGVGTMWAAVGLFIAPSVFVLILAGGADLERVPLGQRLAAMALPTLAVAVLFLLRRRRVQQAPTGALQERFGPDVPVPTQPPPLRRAFALGGWTYCVAGVAFVPVALGWGLLLKSVGVEPVAQAPVKEVVDSASNSVPILMFVFGTFVAPFTEECIFRGMLFPGLKRVLGGGSRATWLAAVIVSVVFAGIHLNAYAFLPLLALALVLNWIFATTNSLAACVIAHALHNGLTMVPLLLLRYGG